MLRLLSQHQDHQLNKTNLFRDSLNPAHGSLLAGEQSDTLVLLRLYDRKSRIEEPNKKQCRHEGVSPTSKFVCWQLLWHLSLKAIQTETIDRSAKLAQYAFAMEFEHRQAMPCVVHVRSLLSLWRS